MSTETLRVVILASGSHGLTGPARLEIHRGDVTHVNVWPDAGKGRTFRAESIERGPTALVIRSANTEWRFDEVGE